MKVNMTPNPLDVVTIHASQGDTEARQWEFELHNNGEQIDTSDVKEQLVFKAYKGGTEQLLPENGSTPTTSPFKGDIRYPQGLLTDQEFTYRQSPTEEDGNAKITDIKGNTLVWNQIVKNDAAATIINGVTYTKSGNKWSASGTATEAVSAQVINASSFGLKNGHKYLCKGCPNGGSNNTYYFGISGIQIDTGNGGIWTSTYADGTVAFPRFDVRQGTTVNFTDMQFICVDLTQMFGPGNEPSTVEEFTSLFSLPYYSYNQGSLLSFMGNGIKTVGKNLFDFSQFANGTITFENGVLTGTAGQFYSAVGIDLVYPKNTQITISFDARTEQNQASTGGGVYLISNENGTPVQLATTVNNTTAIQHIIVTIPSNRHIDKLGWVYGSGSQNIWHITNFQVEFGATETSYEPYTSSTLSLPISTYFPNGMKSAGNVYDELTESKAITRIGRVDLGTLTYTKGGADNKCFATTGLQDLIKPAAWTGSKVNAMCIAFTSDEGNKVYRHVEDKTMGTDGNGLMYFYDSAYESSTVEQFKSAMSNVYLYYELETPTETPITTASLVTENAEIPLSNNDGVLIGKCTEQLSENPGFIDAKIKLADSDGECYSNKLQLHIERSPQ